MARRLFLMLLGAFTAATAAAQSGYDLDQVRGIKFFRGSEAAREVLARQGFVVVDREFKQVFEAYVSNPLPPFVTVDSAWHTYHFLLEAAVRRIEDLQVARLREFSAGLLERAWEEAQKRPQGLAADVARYAAVGVLLGQPEPEARVVPEPLRDEARAAALFLRRGSGSRVLLFFGLKFMAEHFRATSFYTRDEDLAAYFRARQWYALANFRLESDRETAAAVRLSLLMKSDAELSGLHEALTAPIDPLLGPTDDPGLPEYQTIASGLWNDDAADEVIKAKIPVFQSEAHKLPAPLINDQFLYPAQYADWPENTRGFRLLGPRRLPSAALFQRTVAPTVRGRMFPSGLDFFATGPLGSAAGKRALRQAEPDHAARILAQSPPEFPASLHGDALELLGVLQKPLPEIVPAALRRPEWSDKQLWTQLGAWAQERHTWALHTKLTVHYTGLSIREPGMVSPYPEFFKGLAKLALDTRKVLEEHDDPRQLNPRPIGERLLALFKVARKFLSIEPQRPTPEEMKIIWRDGEILERLTKHLVEKGMSRKDKDALVAKAMDQWERIAQKAADGKPLNEEEKEFIRDATPVRDIAGNLSKLAEECRWLASVAEKHLRGKPLNPGDASKLQDYGATLGALHFYGGNAWLSPRDDFPMVVPIFSSPITEKMLYAGLGRPEALYVIAASSSVPRGEDGFPPQDEKEKARIAEENAKPFVLLRGAVLSYREIRRPYDQLLDDESWRAEIRAGKAPPPPAFTSSFRAARAKRPKSAKGE